MSAPALPFEPPQPVSHAVARLRFLVRLYVLAEGLAATAIAAAAAFWIGLAIDWLWEPGPEVRIAMWAGAILAIGAVAWRLLVRRVGAALPSGSLALLVERRFPQLGDSLATTIGASRTAPEGVHRQLLTHTARDAADKLRGVELRRVFDPRPLIVKLIVALSLVGAVGMFAAASSDAFAFWLERMRLSTELWPRRVRLTVVGFDRRAGQNIINVARDSDFKLEVLASLADGHEAPDEVEIRWRRPSDGGRGQGPMLRIGEATAGVDSAQRYEFTFKVSADVEFDVIGGDDRVRNLRLRAVERPAAARIALECRYPDYMRRLPRLVLSTGRAELPEGTAAVCRIEANKPLRRVIVRDALEGGELPVRISASKPQEFSFAVGAIRADGQWLITMHDRDGVENSEPFRFSISVVPDAAPEAAVQLRGIGSAVTPDARIPWRGRITDDYGIDDAWFEYQVDDGHAERQPFATAPDGMAELRMTEALDLADVNPTSSRRRIELKPGQKLLLAVAARDAFDLPPSTLPAGDESPAGRSPNTRSSSATDEERGGPPGNIGRSPRFELNVVTPSELRGLLERRELGLRQRFEVIYQRMEEVHDLVSRIDLAPPAPEAEDGDPQARQPQTNAPSSQNVNRIAGARQNATQLAFETSGVADGFDDILAELTNNRIVTEELNERLDAGIAAPLKEISGEMLPRLEEQLASAVAALEAGEGEPNRRIAEAGAQAEEVLAAMKRVLDRMLELENYNEIVEILRGIVADHEKLKQQTIEEQRRKLRSLLDE